MGSSPMKLALTFALALVSSTAAFVSSGERAHATEAWFVAPGGDDGNDCLTPTTTCETIGGAIAKASAGDIVVAAVGSYASEGDVLRVDRDIRLLGGWHTSFETRSGRSTLSGSSLRIEPNVVADVDRFEIRDHPGTAPDSAVRNSGDLLITRSDIHHNSGIGIESHSELWVIETTVRDNGSSGIRVSATANIFDSTISGHSHSITVGGGIENSGDLMIVSSTISGNESASGGGVNNRGDLMIFDSTITDNDGGLWPNAGGLQTGPGTALVANTIIAGNTNDRGPGDCFGDIMSAGNNLFGPLSFCPVGIPDDMSSSEPLLGPLRDNGGSTLTHAPLPGSPVIDAVDGPCEPFDQRGIARPQGSACDIGAVEKLDAIDPARRLCFEPEGFPGGAAVVNLTPVLATSAGNGQLVSSDVTDPPIAANVNFGPGSVDPNVAVASIGDDGKVCYVNSHHASVHLVADHLGTIDADSYTPATTTGAPKRTVDTRIGLVVL